ncbi:ATP-binding protein [Actinomadura xylanilytica]|uniref:ATP-binding protein n=1 Tax=Actinomadura xylanilytica TaxID=887459 RepID=UPI00255ADD18|nr:ATP-binding protein [Actinomadura xylanilytica]MDL4775483.1 ATP-binding protein [Actinomadura xylanilytica]
MSAHLSPDPPTDRTPLERALLVWLASVVLIGGTWLWAVFAATQPVKPLVAWGGGPAALAACVLVTLAAHRSMVARRLDVRLAEARDTAARLERQIVDLSAGTLPEVLRQVRAGVPAETALAEVPRPASPGLRRVLHWAAHEVAAGERAAAAARSELAELEGQTVRLLDDTFPEIVQRIRLDGTSSDTLLGTLPLPEHPVARRLMQNVTRDLSDCERTNAMLLGFCAEGAARNQAACTRMLAQLRELEFQFAEDEVFADLLELDHGVSMMGRTSDTIALLAGGCTGRRWTKPIIMESILRGALGRIADYRRLRLHSVSEAAIVGVAAEGVMHALAELMDNAAVFSTRDHEVHVYVEEVDSGIVIVVEDAGIGMRKRERARAERQVTSPDTETNLSKERLGLAVVGRLAKKHGLRISFRPSARGGIGAVMWIPRTLVTEPLELPYSRPPRTRPRAPGRWGALSEAARSTPFPSPVPAPPGSTKAPARLPRRPVGASLVGIPDLLDSRFRRTDSVPADTGVRAPAPTPAPAPLPAATPTPDPTPANANGDPADRLAAFRRSSARAPGAEDPAGGAGPTDTAGHNGTAAQDDR